MTKNEKIAALEKEVADLRYTISLMQMQIAALKQPVIYPVYPAPEPCWPQPFVTYTGDTPVSFEQQTSLLS